MPESPQRPDLQQTTRSGPGRILIAVYAIWSVAAASRSIVEITTKFEVAPTAYVLSAFAAVVYIVGTVCLARGTARFRKIAFVSCIVELLGVLIVGIVSYVVPEEFPDATVWSHFGSGYAFIPLILPIAALWWLRRTRNVPA